MWQKLFALFVAVELAISSPAQSERGVADLMFPQTRLILSKDVRTYLNGFSTADWNDFAKYGVESIDRQKRLETNLLNSDITVQNGSLSHVQLLDTLPNKESKRVCDIARKILKSSLYVYNSKCVPRGISAEECRTYLESKPLPEDSELQTQCKKILLNQRSGYHVFRRLLNRRYQDGFYKIPSEEQLPPAWSISMGLYEPDSSRQVTQSNEDPKRNLALVQWAQFVEHDLSKPVVTSMNDGSSIECCNRNQNTLLPRHHHPACAPILSKATKENFGWRNCLNYVRSALAVGGQCNFGAFEQINQATGSLDLSQLYGFTAGVAQNMRAFKHGNLKSTSTGLRMNDLLPITTNEEWHKFCALGGNKNLTNCFVAGDSRVNSSPYSILIYTIFMRNHNRVAAELRSNNPSWNDEQLFQAAKSINVDIYRRIVMDEWLPIVLGERLAADVLTSPSDSSKVEVSNEFGVAAIRFYLSMLPNVLHNSPTDNDVSVKLGQNNVLTDLFALKDEIYKPQLQYTAKILDDILQSLLRQHAMKMDSSYSGALVWNKEDDTKPTHIDVLALDIQRGRDHGLQPYFKYVEACHKVKVDDWSDLDNFISKDNIDKLKTVYSSWADVDLIVGGISERTVDGTVGQTFSCILAEQFLNIHQVHKQQQSDAALLEPYRALNASKLLCFNSELKVVPQNIFQLPSDSNRLIDCESVV